MLYYKYRPHTHRFTFLNCFSCICASPRTPEDHGAKAIDIDERIRFWLKPVMENTFTNSIVHEFLYIGGFLYKEQGRQSLQWYIRELLEKKQLLIWNYPVDKRSEQYWLFQLFTNYCCICCYKTPFTCISPCLQYYQRGKGLLLHPRNN